MIGPNGGLGGKTKSIYSVMEVFLGLPVLKSTPCVSSRVAGNIVLTYEHLTNLLMLQKEKTYNL